MFFRQDEEVRTDRWLALRRERGHALEISHQLPHAGCEGTYSKRLFVAVVPLPAAFAVASAPKALDGFGPMP